MTATPPLLRIGTRGSPLALAQAHEVRDRLAAAHPDLAAEGAVTIVIIKTSGDKILDRPLAEVGGKGLFTKEIEDALLAEEIDIAVHSMKDVPTWFPDGLMIDCILPREDPRDAFFSEKAASLADLPAGAKVGTSSLRRQALVLLRRPDVEIVSLRGNVQTRMGKLAAGEVDATLLAMAGLRRLGLAQHARGVLEPEDMLPAVAQGAIGIERRSKDDATAARLAALNDDASALRVTAERAVLARLDGSCRTPIAALAEIQGDELWLRALLAKPDGSEAVRGERRGSLSDAFRLGDDLGEELKAQAGPDFLATFPGMETGWKG